MATSRPKGRSFAALGCLLSLLALLILASPAAALDYLILGDSHSVGQFGKSLDASLTAKGHRTAFYAVCGASAKWWLIPPAKRGRLSICYAYHDYGGAHSAHDGATPAPLPSFDDLMALSPQFVVFVLGSNGPGSTPDAADEMMRKLPSGVGCLWVGPPPMPSQLTAIGTLNNAMPARLNASGHSCTYLDSTNLHCDAAGQPSFNAQDPLCIKSSDAYKDHFSGDPAKRWARAVVSKLP